MARLAGSNKDAPPPDFPIRPISIQPMERYIPATHTPRPLTPAAPPLLYAHPKPQSYRTHEAVPATDIAASPARERGPGAPASCDFRRCVDVTTARSHTRTEHPQGCFFIARNLSKTSVENDPRDPPNKRNSFTETPENQGERAMNSTAETQT
ncbi:hypothetical protein IEQ11_17870 [Lysobacter capsici]|uniref:hypothetical protein n=1 Tax=Lysobacter capsici TaxID=435897 RepID=UPI00177D9B82|nr:hypothetical protein [Lysobacter capsici]UOF13602.1 hypothetical protein IEQ11_17870 [Lysobacter capsici]